MIFHLITYHQRTISPSDSTINKHTQKKTNTLTHTHGNFSIGLGALAASEKQCRRTVTQSENVSVQYGKPSSHRSAGPADLF